MTSVGEASALSNDELAAAMASLMQEYARRSETDAASLSREARWGDRLTATETAIVSVDLLRAAEITSFELAAMFNV